MSRPLPWVERALSLLLQPRVMVSVQSLDCIAAFQTLCSEQKADLYEHAAQAALERKSFRRGRALLRLARQLRPKSAKNAFLMGQANELDPRGCDHRAIRYFTRAIRLNTDEPQFKAHLGRAQVRIGETKAGVRTLCKAAEAALHDVATLSVVMEGLTAAGHAELALGFCQRAKFLNPRCQALEQLYRRAQYDTALQEQRDARCSEFTVQPTLKLHTHKPKTTVASRHTRNDAGTQRPQAHIGRLRAFRAE